MSAEQNNIGVGPRRGAIDFREPADIVPLIAGRRSVAVGRITSYNVCYTKLLRNNFDIEPIKLELGEK